MKKKRIYLIVIIILIIVAIIGIIYVANNKDKKKVVKVNVVETIEKFNYSLEDTASLYYVDLFNELKKCLKKEEIDKEEYASLVTRLFISDFFTLSNKISKNDVGGVQYVYTDYQEDFKRFAKEEIYGSLENNIYGNRKQELPEVSKVIIDNVTPSNFTYGDLEYDSYIFNVKIEYVVDMGYPTSKEVVVVSNNDLMEVVKLD